MYIYLVLTDANYGVSSVHLTLYQAKLACQVLPFDCSISSYSLDDSSRDFYIAFENAPYGGHRQVETNLQKILESLNSSSNTLIQHYRLQGRYLQCLKEIRV